MHVYERANKASGSISASLVLSTGTRFPFVFTVSGKREYHQCLFMKFADLLLCASGNLSVSKLLLQILHQLQHLNQHFYHCGHSLQAAMKKSKHILVVNMFQPILVMKKMLSTVNYKQQCS